MKAKRFNKQDWFVFSGAEEFEDGSDPFIAQNENFAIIGDHEGITVYRSSLESVSLDEEHVVHIESSGPMSPSKAEIIVNAVASIVTSYDNPTEAIQFLKGLYVL